jgi:hypothetical protein
MRFTTTIITSPIELAKVESEIDAFLDQHSKNPFMLSQFTKSAMQLNRGPKKTPAVLVTRVNGEIIGVSQVVFKRFLGLQTVSFLLKDSLSPDFVFENSYRKEAVEHLLNLFFKKMKCHSLSLTFPVESPNLPILEGLCQKNNIGHNRKIDIENGHRILPIGCSWEEFQKKQGTAFRKRFRVAERDLTRAGEWTVTCIEDLDKQTANFALQKILSIEGSSWKQTWRSQLGMSADADLLWAWHASIFLVNANPQFKMYLWFLEINCQSLAYSIIFKYKQVAIGVKTSYVEKYRKLGLGIYITNVAIRALFEGNEVKHLDFLTNLPHMSVWTHTSLPRVTFVVNRRKSFGLFFWALQTFKKSSRAKALAKKILS